LKQIFDRFPKDLQHTPRVARILFANLEKRGKMPPMNNTWLTINQAATALACSTTHIRRMAKAGKLLCQDIGLGKQSILRVQIPQPDAPTRPVMPPRRRAAYVPQILK
jgi:hypothetical protein